MNSQNIAGPGAGRQADATQSVRLLFLDRDGTLNKTLNGRPPNAPGEVELLPNTNQVLARWVTEGWRPVVITNQGGVASGYMSEAQAHAVQEAVISALQVAVEVSFLCPHMAGASVAKYDLDCPNRKPRPGFILAALDQFGARPQDCLFVGDSITDQQAAEAVDVPFQWADQFFGRPIDRGFRTKQGQWVQIRQVDDREMQSMWESMPEPARTQSAANLAFESPRQQDDLYLTAQRRNRIVGSLTITRKRTRGDRGDADLALWVSTSHQGAGIDQTLMQVGMEWSGRQRDLYRLCVEVSDTDAPFARLCCRLGFAEQDSNPRSETGSILTLTCYQ